MILHLDHLSNNLSSTLILDYDSRNWSDLTGDIRFLNHVRKYFLQINFNLCWKLFKKRVADILLLMKVVFETLLRK